MSQLISVILLLSLALYGSNVFGWGFLRSAVGVVVLVAFLAVVSQKPLLVYLLILGGWALGAGYLFLEGRGSLLLVTHLLPFAIVFGGKYALVSMRRALSVPYVVPVGFILILAPLMTEDPWRLAAEAGRSLIFFAAVAVLPLLVYAVRAVLQTEPVLLLSNASYELGREARMPQETISAVRRMNFGDPKLKFSEKELRAILDESYDEAYRHSNMYHVTRVLERKFQSRAIGDLFSFVAGAAAGSFGLIYLLSVFAVPQSLAREWAKVDAIPTVSISVLGVSLTLPTGPYVSVSALFAVVAVAGFLAFSATEEKYQKAIVRATVQDRATRLLNLALPYIKVADDSERFPQPAEAGSDSESSDAPAASDGGRPVPPKRSERRGPGRPRRQRRRP